MRGDPQILEALNEIARGNDNMKCNYAAAPAEDAMLLATRVVVHAVLSSGHRALRWPALGLPNARA